MIANISSSGSDYEDTLSTLKYANRAKKIKTSLSKNIKQSGNNASDYTRILD